jgi:hypothetical protein
MKFAFMKKLIAHPVLLSLFSLSVCAAGAGVGYATWTYSSVNVDPSANAFKNGTATAGAFGFAYDVAPDYPTVVETTKSGNAGGSYDENGNKISGTYFYSSTDNTNTAHYIAFSTIPTNYYGTHTSIVYPVYMTYDSYSYKFDSYAYTGSTKASNKSSSYRVYGMEDHDSSYSRDNAHALDMFVPLSYTKIGVASFAGLWAMTTFTFTQVGNATASTSLAIGSYAFYNDYSLGYINFGSNLKSIGSYAFSYTGNASYTPTSTIYATYPGTKASWTNGVTLSSNWHLGRAVVVKCGDYYINYAADGTITYSAIIA